MSWATLNGIPVTRAALVVPYTGIWHADVSLDRTVEVSGPQVLLIGTYTWLATAVRAVDFAGTRRLRLVGGQGGWRKTVPPELYVSPVGVPTTTVLADVAGLVGEIPPVVDPTLQPTVGTAFGRQGGLASLVLQQVCGDQWWMDPSGVVQTAPRLGIVKSLFSVENVDGASGKYTIQTESPGDWAPGNVFAGPTVSGTISRTMWAIDEAGVRVEVLAA